MIKHKAHRQWKDLAQVDHIALKWLCIMPLVMLNLDILSTFANSVDQDQLASEDAK